MVSRSHGCRGDDGDGVDVAAEVEGDGVVAQTRKGTSRHFSASIRSDRAEARVFGEVWSYTVNLILCVTGPHPSLHFCQSCQALNPSSLALLQKRLCVEVSTEEGNWQTATRKSLLLLLASSDRAYERLCTYERPSHHTI